MKKYNPNLILMTNFDYINNYKFDAQCFKKNIFIYHVTKDSCSYTFLREHQHNFFEREEYDINYLLKNIPLSNFKQFFKPLQIDTPEVLNKTPSLKRIKGLTSLTRLSTYLTRSGKKLKFSKLISRSLFDIIKTLNYNNLNSSMVLNN